MHILLLGPSDLSYNSGSIIYTKNLYRHMKSLKHRVTLFSCSSNFETDIDKRDVYVNEKLLEHTVITDREVNEDEIINYITYVLNKVIEINKEEKIDIIHVLYASFLSQIAILVKQIFNIPVVISCFGRDINVSSDRLHVWSVQESIKEADQIIVTNQDLANQIDSKGNSGKCIILPMPIDLPKLDINNYHKTNKVMNILTINSCFKEDKNIDLLIKATSNLNKIHLFIAGADDHPTKKNEIRLKQLVKTLNMDDKVTFTGYLNREQVFSQLQASDIFVDARKFSNFSSVLIEAMYMKVPVICSRNKFSLEIFQNDENRLFDINNANYLSEIINLCRNENYRQDLISRQDIWMKNHLEIFEPNKHFNKILNIYKELTYDYRITKRKY